MAVEKSKRELNNPENISLSVQDTGFILSLVNRASINGSELKQAMSTTKKFESLHDYLVKKEEIIRGV